MIRLALQMLVGDTTKWLGVLLGLFLSTFLIIHLLGMFNGMMARTYALVTDVPQAEIWVMDPSVQYVDEPVGLPPTALLRVQGVEGVKWATPLLISSMRVRLPGGASRSVLLIGVDDSTFVGAPPGLKLDDVRRLRELDACMVDRLSAESQLMLPIHPPLDRRIDPEAPPLPTRTMRAGDEFYTNDHRLWVTKLVELGPRFLSRPTVYTTFTRAEDILPTQRNLLSYVLVKSDPGTNPRVVTRRIQQATGLRARTSAEFCDDTYWYYVRTTGVVDRIAFMVGIGIVVGVSVSALLLYLFTIENSRYYAVLIAMGTQRLTVSAMVAVQALVCGAIGYGLGVGASALVGRIMPASSMPYAMTGWALGGGAVIVLFICVFAAVLSLRALFRLEPAMAFQR